AYLPASTTNLPAVVNTSKSESDFSSEREILYKVLFDMKSDLNDLKKLTLELMKNGNSKEVEKKNESLIQKIYGNQDDEDYGEEVDDDLISIPEQTILSPEIPNKLDKYHFAEEIEEEETLSLHDKELELIKKSLERHDGKRK